MKYLKPYLKTFKNTIEDSPTQPQVGDIVKCVTKSSSKFLIINKLYTIKTIINNDPLTNIHMAKGTFYTFEEILQTHNYYNYNFMKISKEEAEEYKLKNTISKFNI